MSRLLDHNGQPFHVKRQRAIEAMTWDEAVKTRAELQALLNDCPDMPPDAPVRRQLDAIEALLSGPMLGRG